jgi:hypothetical protein
VTHDPVGFGSALRRAADPAALAEGPQEMYDQRLFMKTLSRFCVVLPEHHDLDAAALAELTKSVTAVLGLGGSGVTWPRRGSCSS